MISPGNDIDTRLLDCTRSQLLILMIIEKMGVDGKFEASFTELARISGISLRAVTSAIALLLASGLLERIDQGGCDGRSNIYGVSDGKV